MIFLQYIPTVQRISPQLPGCTEVIGRNSPDHDRILFCIELEQIRIYPGINTVEGYVKRDVAYDPDVLLMCVILYSQPLPEKQVLYEFVEFDVIRQKGMERF